MATPLILLTPAIALAMGFPAVGEQFGAFFWWAAPMGAVAAPAVGLVVAHVARRARALRRFVIMEAVAGVPVLCFWIFATLLAECPPGDRC